MLKYLFKLNNDYCLYILFGGLGNQLFQYNHSKYLEEKFKTKFYYLDISKIYKVDKLYGSNVYHGVNLSELFEFEINYLNTETMIRKPFNLFIVSFALRIFLYIYNKFGIKLSGSLFYDSDVNYELLEEKIKSEKLLIFHGYWQQSFSEYPAKNYFKYFKFVKSLKIPNQLKKYYESDNIALHVRRGDFTKTKKGKKILGSISFEYYFNAIKLLREKVGNLQVIIFTDDREWVKENLRDRIPNCILFNKKFSNYKNDFYFMTKSSHIVLSNSTFSWWAALLLRVNNPNSIIILPKFFNNKLIEDYRIPFEENIYIVNNKTN